LCVLSVSAGFTALTDAISGNGAMTSLNMSKNGLLSKEAGTVLGEMLKGNTILKELDVSSSGEGMLSYKRDGSGFAEELAVAIKDMRALSKLAINNNNIPKEQVEELKTQCALKGVVLENAPSGESDEGCAQQ
jgi:Ran GTPase-activating protein (RanGAP) involved in mRNA processing and transport